VLMCSHKKRDARCSQAAPILLAQVRPLAPLPLPQRVRAAPLRPGRLDQPHPGGFMTAC
jgi:hypothetical protein